MIYAAVFGFQSSHSPVSPAITNTPLRLRVFYWFAARLISLLQVVLDSQAAFCMLRDHHRTLRLLNPASGEDVVDVGQVRVVLVFGQMCPIRTTQRSV